MEWNGIFALVVKKRNRGSQEDGVSKKSISEIMPGYHSNYNSHCSSHAFHTVNRAFMSGQ